MATRRPGSVSKGRTAGPSGLSFERLVAVIGRAHTDLGARASRAVNAALTLRNWLIGLNIVEYEQKGIDRARYGDRLLDRLSVRLGREGVSRCEVRELRRYRLFYLSYPKIRETLSPELNVDGDHGGGDLVTKLSFSHIVELLQCESQTKRRFYEAECIDGNWSVRELRRQIASLYFERSQLSTDKRKLTTLAQQGGRRAGTMLTVRDPYVFEFLGLKPQEVMGESHLEDQLLDKLQAFLIELGQGFCFEARQKRILIGDGHDFVDLVFYHRILKCHVLVELKAAAFSHENIGQLNTYVSWYRRNMMTSGDNPPVGILLCTQKDHALVEYALAGIDNDLFVSKYLLELPTKEEMQRFIESQLTDGTR